MSKQVGHRLKFHVWDRALNERIGVNIDFEVCEEVMKKMESNWYDITYWEIRDELLMKVNHHE